MLQWRPIIETRLAADGKGWENTSFPEPPENEGGEPKGLVISRAGTREEAEALGAAAAGSDRAEHVVYDEAGEVALRRTYTD